MEKKKKVLYLQCFLCENLTVGMNFIYTFNLQVEVYISFVAEGLEDVNGRTQITTHPP